MISDDDYGARGGDGHGDGPSATDDSLAGLRLAATIARYVLFAVGLLSLVVSRSLSAVIPWWVYMSLMLIFGAATFFVLLSRSRLAGHRGGMVYRGGGMFGYSRLGSNPSVASRYGHNNLDESEPFLGSAAAGGPSAALPRQRIEYFGFRNGLGNVVQVDLRALRMAMIDRDFTAEDYDMLLDLDRSPAGTYANSYPAAPASLVRQLPEFVVDSNGSSSCDQAAMLDKDCVICLDQFKAGDRVRTLPCLHHFHAQCVDRWLSEQQGVCPACRLPLV